MKAGEQDGTRRGYRRWYGTISPTFYHPTRYIFIGKTITHLFFQQDPTTIGLLHVSLLSEASARQVDNPVD